MRSQKICTIPECGREHKCKGLCNRHYMNMKRCGNPLQVRTGICDLPIKKCHSCGFLKKIDEFGMHKGRGHHLPRCKKCTAIYKKEWNRSYCKNYYQKSKAQRRGQALKQKFGISNREYEVMWLKQTGVCAICFRPETKIDCKNLGKIKKLAVDHDHKSGKVRGLLCSACNLAIGQFKESKYNLLNAIKYLSNYE